MKKLPIILFSIAIAVLYFLYFFSPFKKEQAQRETQNSIGKLEFKIAFINNDTLLAYYDYYIDIKQEFERKKIKAERQLKNREDKLREDVMSAEKRAKAGLMSSNEIKKTQEKITKDQQDLQIFSQTLNEGLFEEERIHQQNLLTKISDYINIYNKEKGYDLIFNYVHGGTLWYGEKGIDITEDVISRLNKIYAQEKANEKK